MIARYITASIRRDFLLYIFIVLSISIGAGIILSCSYLILSWRDKVGSELRQRNANIEVIPYNAEKKIDPELSWRLYTIFWGNQILKVVPILEVDSMVYEKKRSYPVKIAGTFFNSRRIVGNIKRKVGLDGDLNSGEALVGDRLAERLGLVKGMDIKVKKGEKFTSLKVKGLYRGIGQLESYIIVPIKDLWEDGISKSKIDRILVSVSTRPIDAFGRSDPDKMTPNEFDRWICTPYITSIAKEISELDSNIIARPIWRVAAFEDRVLSETENFLYVIISASFLVAIVISLFVFSIIYKGRKRDIYLMRSLGLSTKRVVGLFISFDIFLVGVITIFSTFFCVVFYRGGLYRLLPEGIISLRDIVVYSLFIIFSMVLLSDLPYFVRSMYKNQGFFK